MKNRKRKNKINSTGKLRKTRKTIEPSKYSPKIKTLN